MFETTQSSVNPLAILKQPKPPRLYTLDEYLRMEGRSQDKYEYYNGKIIKMPYARARHNILSSNATIHIGSAIQALGKNYILFSSDQKIYLPELNYGLYADALVVCEEPKYWQGNDLLLINPVLIIEVLSKSTQKYDRTGKFDEYKTLPSFKEYLLIRQDECHVESRYKEEPNLWRETTATNLDSNIFLKSIGCELSLKALYKNVKLDT